MALRGGDFTTTYCAEVRSLYLSGVRGTSFYTIGSGLAYTGD